jgi:TPR repeat protein
MRALIAAIFGVVFAFALTPVAANADPFMDGLDAYVNGDYATTLRLWRPLAEQGDADAQYILGDMYHDGEGVPQDYDAAVKWYRLAAEQGNANGQHNLGRMYEKGRGVPQDHAEAVKWHRLAAEQGHTRARHNIGVMYRDGIGVSQDYVLAHKWFNLAASRDGDEQARDEVAALMTPAQITEAQRLAREWRPRGSGIML